MTNPTTTAQATVLTDEQIDLLSRAYSGPKWEYQTSIPSLIASHAEGERTDYDVASDELCERWYFDVNDIARRALAALEGSGG